MKHLEGLPVPLRLALRELRVGIAGFRVFLACLILGVGAIAAVGDLTASIRTSLTEQGQTLLGGDVEVRIFQRPANAGERAYFDASGAIAETIRLRGVLKSPRTDKRTLVEVKAIDDAYPLYGRFETSPAGTFADLFGARDGRLGLAADPFLAARLGIGIGDTLELGNRAFELRALIEHEPDRSNEGFLWGPTVMVAQDAIPDTGLILPGSLYYHHYKIKLPAGSDVVRWREDLNAAFPDARWQVRDRDGSAPGVRRFVDNMGMFLALISLMALLIGGVGVGNAVANYMRGKTGVIATLKILGADSGTILKTYLIQISIFSLAAIVVGLGAGVAGAHLVIGLIGDALPVEVGHTVSAVPLVVAAFYGACVSLIFSLWSLAVAKKVPPVQLLRDLVASDKVRPALRYYVYIVALIAIVMGLAIWMSPWKWVGAGFVGGAVAVIVLLRLTGWGITRAVARLPRPRNPALRLALANLHRPGAATGAVVMSLGLGLSLFAMVILIDRNFSDSLNRQIPDEAPAFFLLDIQKDQADAFAVLATSLEGASGLNLVASLRGRVTYVNGVAADQVTPDPDSAWVINGDRTVTYLAALPENNTLVAGQWWPADYAGPPLVSFAAEEAAGLGLALGDSITINVLGRDVTATIANLRNVEWGTRSFNFVMIFAPGTFEAAPHTYMASLDAAPDRESAIHKAITDAFPNVTAIRIRDLLTSIDNILVQIRAAVNYTGLLAILAGILVLSGALAAGYRARVYDSVILKILGAVRANVLAAFVCEYVLLGAVTGVLALIFGAVSAYLVIVGAMDMTFTFYPGAALATVAASLVITLVFGMLNTWKALGEKPSAVLRQF